MAKILNRLEKGICYAALGLLALIPVAEIIIRPFNGVIPASLAIMTHLFLVVGFFAAMIATKSKEHIFIAITQYIKNERLKNILAIGANMISAFVTTILVWDSISFIKYGQSGKRIGFIPDRVFSLVMPLGFAIIAIRFALQAPVKKFKWLPFASILLGTICALPAITKLLWGFDLPEPFLSWVNLSYDMAFDIKLPVILLLIVAALSGTPIFAVIGGIALIMLQSAGGEPDTAPLQIYSAFTDASDLIAIPLFTLTGFFLSESKAGERLVNTFKSLFSWIPGGMIIATVVICAFFTSFTGASGVTILALGGILYTILAEKSKYPERFSIGLLTSVGGIGLLFPPSLPIILVGSTTNSILYFMGLTIENNIIDFFLGAIIPGIIMVLAMIAFAIITSRKVKIPVEPFELKKAGAAIKGSALEILLPVILIGGYFSGILSLVQISAVSVIYVFIAEVLINRDIAIKKVPQVFFKAIPIIGGVLAILAMAKALSYSIIDSQVPEHFADWMQATISSKFVFLLLLNLALLVVGCLMDIFSAILVVLPLIVPLGYAYGIDPIHLGIIFITNLEVGFLTPPVGMNLFLASYRFKRPFVAVCRYVLPFLLIQLAIVLLITYVPWLSTFLPNLFN
ncbi:TRAP transporter large permease subunit [Leadbettera azotonutricia]|uniref:Trap dicarboxylate transporter, dctm subunit n=1 Tax=Leadbettera azotonutricia (strain ATCC BAA-888 / DSM 13862 / ZAS-9) TaxID=545695 RepID=F5Y8U3_LEAAZ|nr:TRAP transporter large permease subunit [Leadbettera azotonutricia]AEF81869.1 trap dicarboxylate transporter, dctm subunit [Leadbettera azotonutricia ZAS-9]